MRQAHEDFQLRNVLAFTAPLAVALHSVTREMRQKNISVMIANTWLQGSCFKMRAGRNALLMVNVKTPN